MYNDIIYREVSKQKNCDEAREEALAMYELYNELAATLDDEQKALLEKYNRAFEKFMFGVCDVAYVQGFENGSNEC